MSAQDGVWAVTVLGRAYNRAQNGQIISGDNKNVCACLTVVCPAVIRAVCLSVSLCVCVQIRRQEAIDKGQAQRRVYVEKPDMRSKKLARKAGERRATMHLCVCVCACACACVCVCGFTRWLQYSASQECEEPENLTVCLCVCAIEQLCRLAAHCCTTMRACV